MTVPRGRAEQFSGPDRESPDVGRQRQPQLIVGDGFAQTDLPPALRD